MCNIVTALVILAITTVINWDVHAGSGGKSVRAFKVLRLLKLAKLLRVTRIVRILERYREQLRSFMAVSALSSHVAPHTSTSTSSR